VTVNEAITKNLVEMWDKEPTQGTPGGSRLFAKWVRLGEDGGWDDWSLVGLFVPGQLRWQGPTAGYEYQIEQRIAAGESAGRIQPEPGLFVWWCRSELDGPDGPRVSDWAGS